MLAANKCCCSQHLLAELDTVAAGLWILLCLEIVQRHPKLAQDGVAQVLQLAQHLLLHFLLALLHQRRQLLHLAGRPCILGIQLQYLDAHDT